jgi:hypothetical protein
MVEAVTIHNISTLIDGNQCFVSKDYHVSSATPLLNGLHKWTQAIKTIRVQYRSAPFGVVTSTK